MLIFGKYKIFFDQLEVSCLALTIHLCILHHVKKSDRVTKCSSFLLVFDVPIGCVCVSNRIFRGKEWIFGAYRAPKLENVKYER